MEKVAIFPEGESAGTLFACDRAYGLDDASIEWIGEAVGAVVLPASEYVGLIFNNNMSLNRQVLRDLDLSSIQLLYFQNPFEVLFNELIEELGSLERAVLDAVPDDEDCALLAGLHGLRALNLSESNISDQGLKMLCELQSLESLVATYTSISDAGLDHLHRLVDLRELDLSLTMVTDAGVKKLSALKTLEELRLCSTGISDDCLEALLELKRLKFLDLSETAISDESIATLQTGLPELQIAYY